MADNALKDKVAIVTGGGRGLGRAMAEGLAHAGARVVVTAARQASELDEVTAAIAAQSGRDRVLSLVSDVTRAEDCARVVEQTTKHWGRLDILVNNAGRGMRYVSEDFLTEPTRFWEADVASWKLVIDTNVNGPFLMARAAVPIMLEAGRGRIINVSMNRSTMSRKGFSPYGPSKAALESETAIWAQDLAGSGVTVNALLPGGATATGMIPEPFMTEHGDQLLAPEVIVPALLWLAGDDSSAVSGQRLDARRFEPAEPTAALEDAGWG